MKTIGLLGGMSWESTVLYYQLINQQVRERLGGLHSAKIALVSVDFHEIEALQRDNDWSGAAARLSKAALQVEGAGADVLLICTNTMHKVAQEIEECIAIPILHVVDATAIRLKNDGIQSVGLLGTRFTMELDFYRNRFQDRYGIEVIVPDQSARDEVHRVIYEELCLGQIRDKSRDIYLEIINQLGQAGAEGIVQGCTEIVLLVQQCHTTLPLYDTTSIHAESAVQWALEDSMPHDQQEFIDNEIVPK